MMAMATMITPTIMEGMGIMGITLIIMVIATILTVTMGEVISPEDIGLKASLTARASDAHAAEHLTLA